MDKVICAGKNYLKHALELGDSVPQEPVLFLKPPSTVWAAERESKAGHSPGTVQLPRGFEVHHEAELVFEIRRSGAGWRLSRYTVGLDLTLRDVQNVLKKSAQPWEKAKVFKNSCVLGPWRELTSLEHIMATPFSLELNGDARQHGLGRDMRWGPEQLLEEAARWFPICDGDILFTGTPEGVGPIRPGDSAVISGTDLKYHVLFS